MSPNLEPDIKAVKEFWENNPLFSGEGKAEVGTLEWFQEWEYVIKEDCFAGKEPEGIYSQGLIPLSRIADIGCGPGFWVRYFLKRGFRNITACDLTWRAIELTIKSLELFGLRRPVGICVGNAEQLPFEDGSFDHINCQGVVHHTHDTDQCIREFHRVLVVSGTLCFSVYYKNFLLRNPPALNILLSLTRRFISLSGRGREKIMLGGDPVEIVRRYDGLDNPVGKAYTLSEIKAMMKNLFDIKEIKYHYFPVRSLPFVIPKNIHSWLHNHFGLMIVVRAVKIR